MKIEADTVKGFRDYLPPESILRAKLKKIIEEKYRLYGFQPVETPLIEFDELMKPDILPGEQEDEAVSDRFRMQDRAGRNLGLRYEFTFQLARILKMNPNLKLPLRRYQIGEVFRDEPIRVGRTRQFTQCDIDIIGDSSINADVECIAIVSEILNELGIEAEFIVNNRKLLDSIIASCELNNKKQVLREIDKLDKIGEDMVKSNLKKFGDTNQVTTLFKLMEKPLEFFEQNKFDGAVDIVSLEKVCKQYGVKITFKPSLARGFSYYTGNIFEVVLKGTKTVISGGGRYDRTVGKYIGKEIPAVGISFSLEALMGICAEQLAKLPLEPIAKVQIISIGQDNAAIKLGKILRQEGIQCITSFDKVGKSLEYANSYAIPFCIFIGKEELAKKKFKIKNMKSGEEKVLVEKSLISLLKKS
jgi:histidyl-tRNA synthetase